jgi:hypothetical protein
VIEPDPGGTAGPAPLTDVARWLAATEGQLERLLAGGWRNAGPGLPEIEAAAAVLHAAGAPAVAARLRRVGAAGAPADGLAAVSLALAACRLLRARLPAPRPEAASSDAGWTALSPSPGSPGSPAAQPSASRRRRTRDVRHRRLLPIGRLAVDDGEAWACLLLRETSTGEPAFAEWLLVDPPEGVPAGGGKSGRGPWLRRVLEGDLHWKARYPLGAAWSVHRFALDLRGEAGDPDGAAPLPALDRFWKALGSNRLQDHALVLGFSPLRVRRLDRAETDGYLWASPEQRHLFAESGKGEVWGLAWEQPPRTAPLLLITPGGFLRRPSFVHLVPGLPSTPAGG